MSACSSDTHYLIRRVAGILVLVSVALGEWASPWFFLLSVFVALNLLQSSFTRWCPMEGWLQKVCGGRFGRSRSTGRAALRGLPARGGGDGGRGIEEGEGAFGLAADGAQEG